MTEKIYEISDISYDIADDGSKIPMYNLYNKETDDILEEPFYADELKVASNNTTPCFNNSLHVGTKVIIRNK